MSNLQKGKAVILYEAETHKRITEIAFQVSGIKDEPIGTDREVVMPDGSKTYIRNGDTISTILVQHVNDPDIFAEMVTHQDEHAAIPPNYGLAPAMAQKYLRMSIQATDPDLKYLYLSWALHFIEDCGFAYHTTADPTVQLSHFEVEQYITSHLSKYEPELMKAVPLNASSAYSAGWTIAGQVSPTAKQMSNAWERKDYAAIDRLATNALKVTTDYVAGTIKNRDTMNANPIMVNESLIPIGIAIVFAVGIGIYYFWNKKR